MDLKGIHLNINKPAPDNETIERIIRHFEEMRYVERVEISLKAEKLLKKIAIPFFFGGLFYAPLLLVTLVLIFWSFTHFLNYSWILRIMRKYCEEMAIGKLQK